MGAMPVHVYDGVTLNGSPGPDGTGAWCLTPGDELDARQYIVTLGNYTDTNGDGKVGFGDYFTMTIDGIPDSDFIYLNVHLDYGLEKQDGWKLVDGSTDSTKDEKADSDAGKGNFYDDIIDHGAYSFSHVDEDGTSYGDVIYNDNMFKKLKGNGGSVGDKNTADDGSDDLFLSDVLVKVVTKANPNSVVWQGKTDKDGWYYADFFATGKATAYKVTADTNGNGVFDVGDVTKEFTLGGATKYVQTDFFGDWPGQGS
jgi:hypothetical protein